MEQRRRHEEILDTFQDDSNSQSIRNHPRHSVFVLEGNSSPSLSTLLNESDDCIPSPYRPLTGGVHLDTGHSNQRHNRRNLMMIPEGRRTFNKSKTTTTTTPSNLMDDISRCQDQVEELIQLFSIMSSNNEQNKTPPLPVLERSKISRMGTQTGEPGPLKRTGLDIVEHRPPGPVLDMECARARLEQSLDDALYVLSKFPASFSPPSCSQFPHVSDPTQFTPLSKRKVYYDSDDEGVELPLVKYLERDGISLFTELDVGPSRRSYQQNANCNFRQISKMEKQPIYTERFKLTPDPVEQQLSPVYPTYRVVFQEPIPFGRSGRNRSQNLSGLESALSYRVRPRIERDAWSEYEEDDLIPDVNPGSIRRTKSAYSVLITDRSLCQKTAADRHQLHTEISVGDSSDWDFIEGGITMPERHHPSPPPSRLAPEVMWTDQSLQLGRSEITHVRNRGRDPACVSLLSEFSESVLHPDATYYKIDQSVQCDLIAGKSEEELAAIEERGCVPSLFRKKKQNSLKRNSDSVHQTMISTSFWPQAM
eukprot:g6726.t1